MGDSLLREDVRAGIRSALMDLKSGVAAKAESVPENAAHYHWLLKRLEGAEGAKDLHAPSSDLKIPPGSPIGQEP